MIEGIGNDIIEIHRMRRIWERYGQLFLNRVFTKPEQAYCLKYKDAARHLAGRFAAKEAIVKALGTGFTNGLSWLDIEILPDPLGRPMVQLTEEWQKHFNHPRILVSISHCKEYATAVAIRTS